LNTNESSSTNRNNIYAHTRCLRRRNEGEWGGEKPRVPDFRRIKTKFAKKKLKNLRDLYFDVKHAKLEYSFRKLFQKEKL